jgi:malate dehydrogenase
MCLASQGQYGVEEGLIFSYPCRTENGIVKVVEGVELNDFGKEKFDVTLKELIEERESVKSAGLI